MAINFNGFVLVISTPTLVRLTLCFTTLCKVAVILYDRYLCLCLFCWNRADITFFFIANLAVVNIFCCRIKKKMKEAGILLHMSYYLIKVFFLIIISNLKNSYQLITVNTRVTFNNLHWKLISRIIKLKVTIKLTLRFLPCVVSAILLTPFFAFVNLLYYQYFLY